MRPWFMVLASFALIGCQSGPNLTLEQWSALETREVDGKRDDVLRAASAVVLDQGYFYLASDNEAGIITAMCVPPQYQDMFCRSGGMRGPVISDTLAVWVRQKSADRSEVRLQTRLNGARTADERRVTEFWASVQRRMLGGDAAPPPAGHAAAALSAQGAR